MLRPAVIWSLFFVCAVAVIAALALLTHHARALEVAGREAAVEADLADRTRFALWRMDTSASPLLAVENNRSPSQFSAFFANGQPGKSTPSPLLIETPDYALLHFEVRENGQWTSPQVPGEEMPRALEVGVSRERIAESEKRLGELRARIPIARLMDRTPARQADASDTLATFERNQATVPQALQKAETVNLLAEDQTQRANVVELATRRGEYAQNVKRRTETPSDMPRTAAPVAAQTAADASSRDRRSLATSMPAESPADPALEPLEFSSYESAWIDGELILWRKVEENGKAWVQGVWLDAESLSASLLTVARDVLPSARLLPTTAGDSGPLGLITLPYLLHPGDLPAIDPSRLPRPVQGFLLLAWGACLLMLVVAGVLIAGVLQLGERRAAFVSSVTHELRTPLTTFRLYAEMLADKMVPDEDQRQQYLRTLQTESARLSHLVENVLAYSRIERGSARAKVESISVAVLMNRIVPRLAERASSAELDFETKFPPTVSAQTLTTDATAVEQILFNLTDNACKYAGPASDPMRLELSVNIHGPLVEFSLRDFGPGISIKQQRKLFRPFHKSATEAAHSQPGVGLGLALSRRLAKALGGNLQYEPAQPGTRFVFTLPIPNRGVQDT